MRFRLLGPIEVRVGEQWRGIGAPKWRSVLAALLINAGQIVPADVLINEVWGDAPPARAANLISIYVLRLRRLIGDEDSGLLVTRAPGYQLRVAATDTDALLFEAMVRDGQRAFAAGDPEGAAGKLTEALALWHGSPLADVPPTPLVEAEAERLTELRLGAAELRITAELACGRHDQAVPEVRRLVADNPLREGLWLLLMRALDGAGRPVEALEVYGRARSIISEQLGVDPGPELRQLHADLLAKDSASAPGTTAAAAVTARPAEPEPAAAGPFPGQDTDGTQERPSRRSRPPAQLPADIADFTGRHAQVKRLCELLSGAARVTVIAGAGGLGKTSLAVHAAHRVHRHFPDGQLYADLLGATPNPLPAADVLARFLLSLGVDAKDIPAGVDERAARYRTALAGRKILVVLDSARDAAQVRPLLPGAASSAVLVTTRSRMPDLASTRLVDLHVLDDAEALALFTKIVGNERAAAEPEATAELLHACAGLPLAIRICAARLATRSGWTIRAMANRLRDEHRRLDELSAGDLSVRPSFQVSFTSLPASTDKQGIDPARAFCLLGLMQEPVISTSAAAALFGVPEYSAGDALEILVDTHLLESPAPDQYRIHNLLWVYAAERAAADLSAQERDDAIGRLRDWHDSERSGAGAEASRAPARSPHEPAPASNAILVGPAARAELRRVHAAATAAPAQIRTLDHLGTSAVRHPQPDALTEAMPDLLPSAQHHGGDPAAAHPPGGERPIREDQQRSTGRGAGGEVITVSQAGESPAGKMTPKAGPGGSMAGGGLPGNGGPPAEGETLLTTMRAVLAAHGILQREQVAAHYDALIRAWPETANHSPQVPAEERQGADWHTPPAHAEMIPDAPGHEQRPDPLTAKTAAEFVRTLAGFRQWAGDPTFREMERRCGHAVASATICTALGRDKDKLPSLRVVLAIVAACGGGEEQQRAYTTAWRKLRMAQEPKLPPERYQG